MMKKERYERTQIDLIEFRSEDVIATSEYEDEILKQNQP